MLRSNQCTRAGVIAALMLVNAAAAHAATVKFDVGGPSQVVATGWTALTLPTLDPPPGGPASVPTSATDSGVTVTLTSLIDATDGLTVSSSGPNGNSGKVLARNRSAVTYSLDSSLNDVLRDVAFYDDCAIDVSGLTPGQYEVALYHHDASTTGPSNVFSVRLSDATTGIGPGASTTLFTNVTATTGTAPTSIASETFLAKARLDGTFTVYLDRTAGAQSVLNGITITSVPEPASLTLAGLGCGLLMMRRRR